VSPWSLALAGWTTRSWARLYTPGLPRERGEGRRGEIASDLWEHAAWAGASGRSSHGTAAHIFGRTVLGMPSDVSWHVAELGGPEMTSGRRAVVGVVVILSALSVLMGAALIGGLFAGGWSATDDGLYGALLLLGVLAGLIGPFVALSGVYVLRRATAEGRSPNDGRTLIVAGTGAIAFFSGVVFWTVIGPIIAGAIVVYWVRQIRLWRNEQPVTP
jgi:MFS family permease